MLKKLIAFLFIMVSVIGCSSSSRVFVRPSSAPKLVGENWHVDLPDNWSVRSEYTDANSFLLEEPNLNIAARMSAAPLSNEQDFSAAQELVEMRVKDMGCSLDLAEHSPGDLVVSLKGKCVKYGANYFHHIIKAQKNIFIVACLYDQIIINGPEVCKNIINGFHYDPYVKGWVRQ